MLYHTSMIIPKTGRVKDKLDYLDYLRQLNWHLCNKIGYTIYIFQSYDASMHYMQFNQFIQEP